jgi:ribosomal protein S18 acetylase RimI-like enzyme
MNPDIDFRHYRRTDLSACASIAVEAFPLIPSRLVGEEASKVMKIQIDSCHVVSNYHELAIVDGEVAGLLFGQVKRKSVLIDTCRTLSLLLLMKVYFLLGRYGSRRKLIRLIRPSLQALRVLRKNMPASGATVVLFAVAPKYQGKGIGRALMDRFVRHALRYKVKAISVPTDETASFWFYERYGFRRWAEYEDPLESYLASRPIKGFIYQLLLDEPAGQVLDFHK